MKTRILAAFILFAFFQNLHAQNHWHWFNPFNKQVAPGYPPAMYRDDTGQFWFATDSANMVQVKNQSGTVMHVVDYSPQWPSLSNFFIDKRNEFWINANGQYARIVNGVSEMIYPPQLNVAGPNGVNLVVDDHKGNEILWGFKFNTSAPDSNLLLKFDGTTYTRIDVNTLPFNFSQSSIGLNGMICDTGGVLYVSFQGQGIYSYNGTAWTFIDTAALFPYLSDKQGNVYFGDNLLFNVQLISPAYRLFKVKGNTALQVPVPDLSGFPDNIIQSWALDHHDNLWYINNGPFLYKHQQGNWHSVYAPQFPFDVVNGWAQHPMLFDSLGNIWSTGDMDPKGAGIYSFRGHNTFGGNVFVDHNANQIKDGPDYPLKSLNILQSPGNLVANTDANGDYSLVFQNLSESYTLLPPAVKYYTLTMGAGTVINPATDSSCCYNIAYTPAINVQDLEITTTCGFARPGFAVNQWLSYRNTGTVFVTDTVTYVYDSKLTFQYANPAPDAVNADTLKWAFSNLQPFELRNIAMVFQLSQTAALSDSIVGFATVNPVATDTTPLNNVSRLSALITGSFDPNEKTVNPDGNIDFEEELTYTVFFQNTGTDTAFNVFVRDTLDAQLDLATLEVLGHSHTMEYIYKGAGVLEFRFLNILLPDSNTNEPLSHGFIKYRVKVKQGMPQGATIHNTASIYFDYNAPIVTNTTVNFIGFLDAPELQANAGFTIYPNPASGKFMVECDLNTEGYVRLLDINSKQVYNARFSGTQHEVTLQGIAPGVYVLQVVSANGVTGARKILLR